MVETAIVGYCLSSANHGKQSTIFRFSGNGVIRRGGGKGRRKKRGSRGYNVQEKGAGPMRKGVQTEGECILQKKRRVKCKRVNSGEVGWEWARRDVWLRV